MPPIEEVVAWIFLAYLALPVLVYLLWILVLRPIARLLKRGKKDGATNATE